MVAHHKCDDVGPLQMAEPNATLGAQHRTLANKGNEAMAYLQFILDYWERLPASIAFIHGHRCRSCGGTPGAPCIYICTVK